MDSSNKSVLVHSFLNIPVELFVLAYQQKEIKPIKLLVYLKAKYGCSVKLTKHAKIEICNALGVKSYKTIKSHLERLKKLKMIGVNGNVIHLRSFKRIIVEQRFKSRLAVEFNLKEINQFEVFGFAALLAYMVRDNKKKERGRAFKLWGAIPRSCSSYFPTALNAIAQFYDLPKSTVKRYKDKAIKLKYILRKRDIRLIEVAKIGNIEKYKVYLNKSNIIKRNGKYYEAFPDLLASNLHFKKRKKMAPYTNGLLRK